MAFIDFSDAAHLALHKSLIAPARTAATEVAEKAEASAPSQWLTALEMRVIEIAREDGLQSLRAQARRGWLARLILGPQPPSKMLANEQLEALRRLAVNAWHHGYTLPASALQTARDAGYSEAVVGAVIDTVARLRAPARKQFP